MKSFFVYLLRCSDGSYYCGQTDSIDARMDQHYAGEIGYTASRKPLELAWQGEFETREGAIAFEQRIKGWSRVKKEALIRGDWTAIQKHAWGTRNPLPTHLADAEPSLSRGEREVESEGDPSIPSFDKLRTGPSIPPFDELRTGPSIPQGERILGVPVSAPVPVPVPVPISVPISVRPEVSKGLIANRNPSNDPPNPSSSLSEILLERLLAHDPDTKRRAIAKAITLLESTRAEHRAQGDELLTALLPHTGQSFRIGISGVPGVGKSTLIEVLGLYLIANGHHVAVLAVDPSSTLSGGSILGDKTRMEKLSVHECAYIRPSPASGNLGGVAEKTREAMLVCEAAGYDVVIVETVGVGQSETAVANMTDMFVLMQLPNAGDDLQAIKKGVMELADLVVINKVDLDANAAARAGAQISSAMQLFSPAGGATGGSHDKAARWQPRVLQLSALHNQGVDKFWDTASAFKAAQSDAGQLQVRRRQQALSWMWERIEAGLKQAFRQDPAVMALLPGLQAEVESGRLSASTAARNMLAAQQSRAQLATK